MSVPRRPLLCRLLRLSCGRRRPIVPAPAAACTEALRQPYFSIRFHARSPCFSGATTLSPSGRTPPPLPSVKSSIKQHSTEATQEVVTVFSDLLQSMVPDAPSRRTLSELKRSLASSKNPSEFASVLSRHSTLLQYPHLWLFFLDILRHGSNPAQAVQAFEWKMVQPNIIFKPQEYALIIRVAGKLGMLEKVKALYHGMPSRGVHRTIEVENAYMYAHAYDSVQNDCVEALNVFKRLRESKGGSVKPNLTSYNIAMSCYSKLRHLQHLEQTFDEIVGAGFAPSVETYNCLMLAYQRLGFWWRMEEIFCRMQCASLNPNALTFRTLVRGYAAAGLLDRMEKAHEAMLSDGRPVKVTTVEAMIAAYKKAGQFVKMEKVLSNVKGTRSQRAVLKLMLNSHACNGRTESMGLLVDEMMRSGHAAFSPRSAEIVVKAFFKNGEHDRIKNFVEAAQSCEWNLNCSFFNTLIYLYAKGEGYAEMRWYFERMIASGCQPNYRTFQIMYRAYLKGNMIEAAQEVLTGMRAMGLCQM